VLANTTANSGDILTTTVVTQPTEGTIVILTDNSIEYTPNEDAGTTDSFTFRVTNQCGNFSENTVNITLLNQPPVIDTSSISTTPNTPAITLDLTNIVSDPNNNIDFSSLRIVTQPISGAVATLDAGGVLSINYAGITFSGDDALDIEICDFVGVCTIQTLIIQNVEVGGENPPIKVYNVVSPNGDGYHDFLEIENIEYYPDNIVIILNRWGVEISRYESYDNQSTIFNTSTLPAGTYYYHILLGKEDVNPATGHFLLKYEQ
jgi:gliding motility-associated-like protein